MLTRRWGCGKSRASASQAMSRVGFIQDTTSQGAEVVPRDRLVVDRAPGGAVHGPARSYSSGFEQVLRVAVNGALRRARRSSPVTGWLSTEHPVALFTVRTRQKRSNSLESLTRVAVNGAPRRARRSSLVTGWLSTEHPVGLFTVRTRQKRSNSLESLTRVPWTGRPAGRGGRLP
jgi:hypothetical protein